MFSTSTRKMGRTASSKDSSEQAVTFSLVMVTFARDDVARQAIGHAASAASTREDVEFKTSDAPLERSVA